MLHIVMFYNIVRHPLSSSLLYQSTWFLSQHASQSHLIQFFDRYNHTTLSLERYVVIKYIVVIPSVSEEL